MALRLLFTNFHEDDGGGHTTYLLALANGLAARHRVFVAAPDGSRLLHAAREIDGVRVTAQDFPVGLDKIPRILAARRHLTAVLREHAFDIVHVNGSADHRLVLSACRDLERRPRIVLTKHNSKPMRTFGQWWRARCTDQVIAVSDHTRRELATSVYARCHLDTVHNGIDIDRYAPWSDIDARAARAALFGDEDGALVLGSNAGTAEYKGWMDLIEALALLPDDQRVRIRVVIAGKPPTDDALQRIDALGLRDGVHFTGLLDDVRPVLAAIDVGFVLSYAVETISFACREMMAMGKPVLLSNYAGLPENIKSGVHGWLVPPRDRQAIAAAISQMFARRQALPAMGAAARMRAECEFGLEYFIASTEAVYVALLSAPVA